MPDLATLQADMVRAIFGEAAAADPRLAVHRNTVLSGLCEALSLSYPITERIVGADFFEQAALGFVRRSPPHEPVLARYGAGFSTFLKSLPGLAEIPYVADIARLDWAVDQAGLAPLDGGDRRIALATEQGPATLTLSPSLRLLRMETAVHAIWLCVRANDEESLADLDWRQGPQWLAVHQGEDDVEVTALTPSCWQLCDALLAGKDLETAITAVAADSDAHSVIARELMGAPFLHVDLQRVS